MATPTELAELERGDGAWENIQVVTSAGANVLVLELTSYLAVEQEVLRFGFLSLWKTFAGVDSRVMELERALAAQQIDSQRQQKHLEGIAQALNAMSEQLRVEQEEAANQQVEERLQHLERQLHDQIAKARSTPVDDAEKAKMERRLDLVEEEMGHVVAVVDQKADTEVVLEQQRTLQEAIRKRCKKDAFDHEVLAIQERLQQQRQELETQLSVSISNFKETQETSFQAEIHNQAAKIHESACQSVQTMLDREAQLQREALGAMDVQIKLCCDALEAQQERIDKVQSEIKEQVRSTIAGDREEIARQCSEAHGRIDYQFRTQEEAFERLRSEQRNLREELVASGKATSEQTAAGITTAVDALDRRLLDRQQQELERMHQQVNEELQLAITQAVKGLEPAKEREQRRLKQHQHLVGRKLAELDQMLQLIGRQLIQNTSQLQVVRNEQLVRNVHLDVEDEDVRYNAELSLQYDGIALAEVSQLRTPILTQETEPEDSAALLARRSRHQEVQEQLDEKLRAYSQVLDASQQPGKEGEAKEEAPSLH